MSDEPAWDGTEQLPKEIKDSDDDVSILSMKGPSKSKQDMKGKHHKKGKSDRSSKKDKKRKRWEIDEEEVKETSTNAALK